MVMMVMKAIHKVNQSDQDEQAALKSQ